MKGTIHAHLSKHESISEAGMQVSSWDALMNMDRTDFFLLQLHEAKIMSS